jgi:hypothetical protein
MSDRRTNGDASATPRRVLVNEAAELLGISDGAVRQRIKRGALKSTHEGGRLYVLLYDDPTADTDRPYDRTIDRTSELIATLREQLQAERQAHAEARRIIAGLVERIPALEAPADAPEAPETDEGEAERAEPRSSTEGPQSASQRHSVVGPPLLREYAVAVFLSMLTILTYGLWTRLPLSGISNALLGGSLILGLLVLPAFFGFRLGRKLRSLRFWRNVAPGGILVGLGNTIAVGAVLVIAVAYTLSSVLFQAGGVSGFSGLVYMFSAIIGNAIQRRKQAQLMEERPSVSGTQGWTPRQQAFVGLAGTIISALVGLIGTILTVMATGNGGS